MNAIKRYGSAGLKLKFLEALPAEGASSGSQDGGDSHRVEVFMGDTIREFKAKLTQACEKEADFWLSKGQDERAKGLESKFRDVRIGYKHLVMVFVPSPKVQRLYAQKLHEGQEYKHAYNQAIQDPSSWQPLDPTRTFGQYPQYGFGRKQAQLLRIVEASESYKLVNLRYREFEREQAKQIYQDKNDSEVCYGWAKYRHQFDTGPSEQSKEKFCPPADLNDFEWRPAFISPGGKDTKETVTYKIKWVFRSGQQKQQEEKLELPKRMVLLAPRCPLVDAYVHVEHLDLLAQARTFRQIGKSDWEIEVMLNKSLDDKWDAEHPDQQNKAATDQASRPPRITVDIIRNYLQRQDVLTAKGDAQAEASKKAQSSMEGSSSPTNKKR
jgi:hypothetical protein